MMNYLWQTLLSLSTSLANAKAFSSTQNGQLANLAKSLRQSQPGDAHF